VLLQEYFTAERTFPRVKPQLGIDVLLQKTAAWDTDHLNIRAVWTATLAFAHSFANNSKGSNPHKYSELDRDARQQFLTREDLSQKLSSSVVTNLECGKKKLLIPLDFSLKGYQQAR
jgi:hypothetical protein